MSNPEEESETGVDNTMITIHELLETLGLEKQATKEALQAKYIELSSEMRLWDDWERALEAVKRDPKSPRADLASQEQTLVEQRALTETQFNELVQFIKAEPDMVEILAYIEEGGEYDNLYDISSASTVVQPSIEMLQDEDYIVPSGVQPGGPEYYGENPRAKSDAQISATDSNYQTAIFRLELYPEEPRREPPMVPISDSGDLLLYGQAWIRAFIRHNQLMAETPPQFRKKFRGLPNFLVWHARRMNELKLIPEPTNTFSGLITRLGANALSFMKLIWAWDGNTDQSLGDLFSEISAKRHPLTGCFQDTLAFLIKAKFIKVYQVSQDLWRVKPLFTGPTSPEVGRIAFRPDGTPYVPTPLSHYDMALISYDENIPFPRKGRFSPKRYMKNGLYHARIGILVQPSNRNMPQFVNPNEWEPPIHRDFEDVQDGKHIRTYALVVSGDIPFRESAQLDPPPNSAYNQADSRYSMRTDWASSLRSAFEARLDNGHMTSGNVRGEVVVAVDKIEKNGQKKYKRQGFCIMKLPHGTYDIPEQDYGEPYNTGHFVVVFTDLASVGEVAGRWLSRVS